MSQMIRWFAGTARILTRLVRRSADENIVATFAYRIMLNLRELQENQADRHS
jgi:hypothetical protein